MSRAEEDLTRLFVDAFDDEASDEALWEATRRSLRRRARARRAAAAAAVAAAVALSAPIIPALLTDRSNDDVRLQDPPEEGEAPAPTARDSWEHLLDRDTEPDADAEAEREPEPEPAAPATEDSAGDPAPEGDADTPASETTDWYAVDLSARIDPEARHFSARQAMDALVASMQFADGAEVTHGVSDVTDSSARGWIRATGFADDSVAGEEIRVRIDRDDVGWFVDPAAEGRATCRRGVDQADRSRCL